MLCFSPSVTELKAFVDPMTVYRIRSRQTEQVIQRDFRGFYGMLFKKKKRDSDLSRRSVLLPEEERRHVTVLKVMDEDLDQTRLVGADFLSSHKDFNTLNHLFFTS